MKLCSGETILIVDDHEINRYTTSRFLRDAGFRTIEAASGQEALLKAQDFPDLILLDVNLPDIDGFRVCRTLRADGATSEIPIVHTSATFVSDDDRIQGLDTGADGYLTRPIEPRVLIATIRSCLRARRAEEGLKQRERELQSMADNTPAMIARFDRRQKFTFVNKAVERATNIPASDLVGKTSLELGLTDKFAIPFGQAFEKTIEMKTEIVFEFWLEASSVNRRFSSTLTPEFSLNGSIQSVLLMARDTTDQYLAEIEREKFVFLVEHSRDFIAIYDAQAHSTYINQAGLQIIGLDSLKEAQSIQLEEIFQAEELTDLKNKFLPEVVNNGHAECEIQVRNLRTRELHCLSCSLVVQLDENKQIGGYSTICREITERKRLEEQLKITASELSDANKKMNEFLATLAHELRNPLAPIRNGLQVMRLSGSDDGIVAEARSMIERQLNQMIRLVDDLLDVSRITRDNLNLKKQRVELAAVILYAVETSRPLIEQVDHTITITLPPTPIFLDADLTRLSQVFSNLLNNSAKYTPAGGHIWLVAEGCEDEVAVTVGDNGLGIPAESLPLIFQMFSQVDRNMEMAQGGLGIGLTLVRRLVEMHGGTVEARSDGPGQGSEFTVRLPVLKLNKQPVTITGNESALAKVPRRILVVDDNKDSAKSLGLMLKLMGNETHTSHDGLAAVEDAEQFRPDIILLDIGLPKLDGYDACRRIREQAWSSGMVIVALTGWGQEEDRRRSKEAGFDHHLVKPVELAALDRLLAAPEPQSPSLQQSNPNQISLRVLVVDDRRDATFMLRTLLDRAGHDVRTAADGPSALALAHDFRPEVVLLDIGLPGMSGLEVAKRIRQESTLKDIVLIAMTGHGEDDDRQRSFEAGFDHHLVKPADIRTIQEILATVKMNSN